MGVDNIFPNTGDRQQEEGAMGTVPHMPCAVGLSQGRLRAHLTSLPPCLWGKAAWPCGSL